MVVLDDMIERRALYAHPDFPAALCKARCGRAAAACASRANSCSSVVPGANAVNRDERSTAPVAATAQPGLSGAPMRPASAVGS